MNFAVLGTGVVGQAHAGKLSNLGHKVIVGTRDPVAALARREAPENSTSVPFGKWASDYPRVRVDTFAKAVGSADVVIEALSGDAAMDVLDSLRDVLRNKILIEISNPLDFSKGRPPTLFVSNDDSLGEQIQRSLPDTKVVKAFNTMNANVQVSPGEVANSDHHLLICGNDKQAKAKVIEIAKNEYGWEKILDLGSIKSARGMEMVLPLWLEILSSLNTAKFNFKVAM